MQTMKAIIQNQYGGPDVLTVENVVVPTPKANELLIEVKASSVTTADSMMMTGKPYVGRLMLGLTKPKYPTPGTGFAGVIQEVGPEVTKFKKGDTVFGESIKTFGTQAEYMTIAEDDLVAIKPEDVSFEKAATVSDGLMTSINFLKNVIKLKPGQHILINGASGSLGSVGVQLAIAYGAKVTAVASTRNADFLESLGAHEVMDYTKTGFFQNLDTYDVIYDTVGKIDFNKAKGSLTENGIYASPVLGGKLLGQMLWTSFFGKKKAKFSATGALPKEVLRNILMEARSFLETGKVSPHIERKYDLNQVHEAHGYIASGRKRGNIVFAMS
jgi:NADPH:quinone reductase-like Zn-dependent oxidoreductase